MRQRCNNPRCKEYRNYGARGISICKEWDEFIGFYNWAMANGYKEDLTLDRIDNDGNYEPNNCRWVSMEVQENNKRTNVYYIINGEKMTLSQCSKKYDISRNSLYYRINVLNYSPEKAVEELLYKKEHPEEFDNHSYVIYNGEKMTAADCARLTNVKRNSLVKYTKKGLSANEAIEIIERNAIKYKRRRA
jgi:hypothetical protein